MREESFQLDDSRRILKSNNVVIFGSNDEFGLSLMEKDATRTNIVFGSFTLLVRKYEARKFLP